MYITKSRLLSIHIRNNKRYLLTNKFNDNVHFFNKNYRSFAAVNSMAHIFSSSVSRIATQSEDSETACPIRPLMASASGYFIFYTCLIETKNV